MAKSKDITIKVMHGSKIVSEFEGHRSKTRKLMKDVVNKWPKSEGSTINIDGDKFTLLRVNDMRKFRRSEIILHVEPFESALASAAAK